MFLDVRLIVVLVVAVVAFIQIKFVTECADRLEIIVLTLEVTRERVVRARLATIWTNSNLGTFRADEFLVVKRSVPGVLIGERHAVVV